MRDATETVDLWFGVTAGTVGPRINRPVSGRQGAALSWVVPLWPWPLVILLVWLPAQGVIGYSLNDFFQIVEHILFLAILMSGSLTRRCICHGRHHGSTARFRGAGRTLQSNG